MKWHHGGPDDLLVAVTVSGSVRLPVSGCSLLSTLSQHTYSQFADVSVSAECSSIITLEVEWEVVSSSKVNPKVTAALTRCRRDNQFRVWPLGSFHFQPDPSYVTMKWMKEGLKGINKIFWLSLGFAFFMDICLITLSLKGSFRLQRDHSCVDIVSEENGSAIKMINYELHQKTMSVMTFLHVSARSFKVMYFSRTCRLDADSSKSFVFLWGSLVLVAIS